MGVLAHITNVLSECPFQDNSVSVLRPEWLLIWITADGPHLKVSPYKSWIKREVHATHEPHHYSLSSQWESSDAKTPTFIMAALDAPLGRSKVIEHNKNDTYAQKDICNFMGSMHRSIYTFTFMAFGWHSNVEEHLNPCTHTHTPAAGQPAWVLVPLGCCAQEGKHNLTFRKLPLSGVLSFHFWATRCTVSAEYSSQSIWVTKMFKKRIRK